MALICKLFGHKWAGCTCSRCGETRNEGHHYDLSPSCDSIMCSACGKTVSISERFASGDVNLHAGKGSRAYYFAAFLDTNDTVQYTGPKIPPSLFSTYYGGQGDISGTGPTSVHHMVSFIWGWPKLDRIIIDAGTILGIDTTETVWQTRFECTNQRLLKTASNRISHPKRIKKIIPHIYGEWILYEDGTLSGSVKYLKLQPLLQTTQTWSGIEYVTGNHFYCAGVTKQGKVQYAGDVSFGKNKVTKWSGVRFIEDWGFEKCIIGVQTDGTLRTTTPKPEIASIRDVHQISVFDEYVHILKTDGTLLRLGKGKISEIGKDFIAVSKDLALKKTGYLEAIADKSREDLKEVREWKIF